MSLEASPAQQELLERHHRTIELWNYKISIIPKRVLPSGHQ
jgi:hypothetical protein